MVESLGNLLRDVSVRRAGCSIMTEVLQPERVDDVAGLLTLRLCGRVPDDVDDALTTLVAEDADAFPFPTSPSPDLADLPALFAHECSVARVAKKVDLPGPRAALSPQSWPAGRRGRPGAG